MYVCIYVYLYNDLFVNIHNNKKCRVFVNALVFKALRLYLLHQSCYAAIGDVQIVGPRIMLPISNLTSTAFLLVEVTEYPEETTKRNKKTAKNYFTYDCRSHPLHWDSNQRPHR